MTAAKKNRSARFAHVFENQTSERLSDIIEVLTGRNVISYQSQIMFSPDRVVEIFVSNVFTKLRVTTRAQAIVKAREGGMGSDAPPS